MALATPTHGPLAWGDLISLADDDRRELLDGELLELDVPTELHEHIVMTLGFFLMSWGRPKSARVLGSGYRIRIRDDRAFMPDVQLYRAENPARRGPRGLEEGRPDLVIEVLSPSTARYDRLVKLAGYAEIGVPEYWLVDPERQLLERLVLRDGLYAHAGGGSDDGLFEPPSFEGLVIPLAELWSE